MTFIYPLTVQHDYSELKFSLRSIEKFASPDQVIIVGSHVPHWIRNVTWLHIPDYPGHKQLSIKTKIAAAIGLYGPGVTMADDIYLLSSTNFPYYYEGTLFNNGESGAKALNKQLTEFGKTIFDFDIHHPVYYSKQFSSVVSKFTSECIVKSAYCNYLSVPAIQTTDCKILKEISQKEIFTFIENRPCFSTGAHSIKSVIPVLEHLFPGKSNFEK